MSMGGQCTKQRRNTAENFNRLSSVHQRYRRQTDRQTTDGRAMTYSERELTFTFAKNTTSNYCDHNKVYISLYAMVGPSVVCRLSVYQIR